MPFNVRVFAYRGISQIDQRMVKQYSADSVFVFEEPYVWSQVISVPDDGTGTAVSSSAYAPTPGHPDASVVLRVEVPPGKAIRYEINPNGNGASTTRAAGNASPMSAAGYNFYNWGPGYTISLCDAVPFA